MAVINENVRFLYLTRARFDAVQKDGNAIYIVRETSGEESIYLGSKLLNKEQMEASGNSTASYVLLKTYWFSWDGFRFNSTYSDFHTLTTTGKSYLIEVMSRNTQSGSNYRYENFSYVKRRANQGFTQIVGGGRDGDSAKLYVNTDLSPLGQIVLDDIDSHDNEYAFDNLTMRVYEEVTN